MILRRKIQAARRVVHLDTSDTAPRAWRVSLGRAVLERLSLHLEVGEVADTQRKLGELGEMIPDRALLALLDGPEETTGVIALSPGLLSAIIEMQTTQRVAKVEPPLRRATRTDASMCTDMIDAALVDLGQELIHAPDVRWCAGYSYASFVEAAASLDLLLPDIPYRVLDCSLKVAGTQRSGRILLALPAEGRGPRPVPRRATPESDMQAAAAWSAEVRETLMHVEAPVEGVVGRLRLPLSQILKLQPDDVLPFDHGGLDEVTLEAAGGTRIALCRLGQNRGMRALRLRALEDPNRSIFGVIPASLDAEPATAAATPPQSTVVRGWAEASDGMVTAARAAS